MMNNKVLDKKTRRKVWLRWLTCGNAGWNYEKMQSVAYAYSMMPALKKIYTNEEDLQKAVKNHLQFYNTNMVTGNLVLGVNMAMEEELNTSGFDAVASVKTSLMGPLAGIGDSIFSAVCRTVFGAIAAYTALEGNPIGAILWMIFNIFGVTAIRYLFLELGYKQGKNVIGSLKTTMNKLINSANILGLTVLGALIPSVISVTMPFTFTIGELQMSVQTDILDKIMPKMLPLSLTLLVYWLLSRKGMNSTKATIIVILISIVCGYFGILG